MYWFWDGNFCNTEFTVNLWNCWEISCSNLLCCEIQTQKLHKCCNYFQRAQQWIVMFYNPFIGLKIKILFSFSNDRVNSVIFVIFDEDILGDWARKFLQGGGNLSIDVLRRFEKNRWNEQTVTILPFAKSNAVRCSKT